MPIMMSSPTSPPASITSLAITPSSVLFTHRGTQHVTGRDVRYDEVPGQAHALRALAGTLSPEDDEAGAWDHGATYFRKPS